MEPQQPQTLDPDLVAICPIWAMHRPEELDVLTSLVDPYFVVRVDAETLRTLDGDARRFDASLTMEEVIELAVDADGQEHLIRLDLRDRQGPRANGRVGYLPKQGAFRVPARRMISEPEPVEHEDPALTLPDAESSAWFQVQVRAFASVDAATAAAVQNVVKVAETYREDAKEREANMLEVVNKALAQTGETQRQLVTLQEKISETRVELARATVPRSDKPGLGGHLAGLWGELAPVVEVGGGLWEAVGGWDGIQEKLSTLAAGAAAKEGGAALSGVVDTVKELGTLWAAQKMGIDPELGTPADVEPPAGGSSADQSTG